MSGVAAHAADGHSQIVHRGLSKCSCSSVAVSWVTWADRPQPGFASKLQTMLHSRSWAALCLLAQRSTLAHSGAMIPGQSRARRPDRRFTRTCNGFRFRCCRELVGPAELLRTSLCFAPRRSSCDPCGSHDAQFARSDFARGANAQICAASCSSLST